MTGDKLQKIKEPSLKVICCLLLATCCLQLVSCANIASNQSPAQLAISAAAPKIYFSGTSKNILAELENYAEIYDIETMEGQIDYLLMRFRTTNYQLERNGVRYTPDKGAEFLIWKMYRPKWKNKVNSAKDFVNVVCKGSSTSGRPYLAIFPDGSRMNLQVLFQNEYDLLEEYLTRGTGTPGHQDTR